MVEHIENILLETDKGIILIQKEDGDSSMLVGTVDNAIEAFQKGSKSVIWRSPKNIKQILTAEFDRR